MTCKDCIHYDVCCDEYEMAHAENCNNFKDESKYLELPCKEGYGIWQIILRSGSPYINYTEAVAFNDEYIIDDCNELLERAEIGETIFFNEESAEEKLEKIKND